MVEIPVIRRAYSCIFGLWAIHNAVCGIPHQVVSGILDTVAHVVRDAELYACVYRRSRPNVSHPICSRSEVTFFFFAPTKA